MNKENEKISVIIPCFNCSKHISDTLSYLERQTFKDFVVICVNDGSTDNTLQLLEEWQRKGSLNIKIINQINGGVSSARNAGIEICQTKYIAFCDSDDLFGYNFLAALYNAAETTNCDTAYCYLTRRFNELSNEEHKSFEIVMSKLSQLEGMEDLLYNMGKIGFCTYIYRTSIIKNEQIVFDEDLKYGEDREFNWKYLSNCRTITRINDVMYYYRINDESVTRRKATWRNTDALVSVDRTYQYLNERKCSFSNEYYKYMYARSMWHVCKNFTVSKDKELFKKLIDNYDVKSCMEVTKKDKQFLVRVASRLFLINPMLFYFFVGLKR